LQSAAGLSLELPYRYRSAPLYLVHCLAPLLTALPNRLDDLGALIRFLRIKPFDEPGNFQSYIIAPFKNANENVLQHLRLLVDSITLRRLKDRVGMTPRNEYYETLEFSDEERQLYGHFANKSNLQLRSMTRASDKLRGNSYAHVLRSILRLRMICDHGMASTSALLPHV
jgi:SNF2 family DNA or RNA helicase